MMIMRTPQIKQRITESNAPADILIINPETIDEDLLTHPNNVYEVGLAVASAKAAINGAKTNRDITKAKLAEEIRNDKESFGIDSDARLTNDLVNDTILGLEEFQDCLYHCNQCQLDLDRASAVHDAIQAKTKALDSLVFLINSGFRAAK